MGIRRERSPRSRSIVSAIECGHVMLLAELRAIIDRLAGFDIQTARTSLNALAADTSMRRSG
jgi:hypothetical protein